MSADVWIEAKACESCGVAPEGAELNITYNLSGMLCEACLLYTSPSPRD